MLKQQIYFRSLSKIENVFPYNSLKRTSVWNFIVFINLYYLFVCITYCLYYLFVCITVLLDPYGCKMQLNKLIN